MISLDRPLVILDLEATGTDPGQARIIQVALKRIHPEDGDCAPDQTWSTMVNPGVEAPDHVLDLTGISREDLKSAFSFPGIADRLSAFLMGADLAGYNIQSYDWPLLQAEYNRHGCSLPGPEDRQIIDAYQLEKRLQPRTLEAVYERRTGELLEDAHDAEADVEATWEILQQQANEVQEADGVTPVASILPEALENFQRGDYLDSDHKLKQTDRGVEVCFGKYQGKTLTELREADRDYLAWMYREITDLQPHIEQVFDE